MVQKSCNPDLQNSTADFLFHEVNFITNQESRWGQGKELPVSDYTPVNQSDSMSVHASSRDTSCNAGSILSIFSGLFIVLDGIKTVQPLRPLFLVLLTQIRLLSSKSLRRETTLTTRRAVEEKSFMLF